MKFDKRKLAVAAFGAVLSVGMVGQASADVYGLSYLDIDNLAVTFNATSGGAGLYTFSANQDAVLNSVPDATSGAASCAGSFGAFTSCSIPNPTLSGAVQNAPPASSGVRTEGNYTKFGKVGDYSNAEAEIVSAVLTGDATTHVTSISESNLDTTFSAQANTNAGSNTNLALTFVGNTGTLSVSFTAVIDVRAEVTDGDIGIAQAASGATLLLQKDGVTLASWAPTGTNTVTTCGVGLVCTATETALSLNNTTSSIGAANVVSGNGSYRLDVSGLTSGNYTLAFNTTTSTDLFRVQQVPAPGTLLLMGTGLLLSMRATRRKK